MWGRCRACEAKDKEIEHLLALLGEANARSEKAQARVSELADPGISRRLAVPVAPIRRDNLVPVQPISGFPGYERELAPPKVEVDQ